MVKNSIVIPCYNEAGRIKQVIWEFNQYLKQCPDDEIIFVDDGSSDNTMNILRENCPYNKQTQFLMLEHRGKWAALISGYKAARGKNVIFLDADLSVDFMLLHKVSRFCKKEDVVCGNRYNSMTQTTIKRWIPSKIFNALFSLMFGFKGVDSQCPAKLIRKSKEADFVFDHMSEGGYVGDVEFLVLAKAVGLRIGSVPVKYVFKRGTFKVGSNSVKMFQGIIRIRDKLRTDYYRLGNTYS
jgi:glycosyltransferase involved in cell wall biosynthesis